MAERSCSRANTYLGLYIEDAHTSKHDILLCYLDFKEVPLSADHTHLTRALLYLGLPEDFITIVSNLYRGASSSFLTPLGPIGQISVLRGPLEGDTIFPSFST